MAKRMTKGLVALSSAAIVSIYGLGYALTQPAAASMAAGVAPTAGAPADSIPAAAPADSDSPSPSAGARASAPAPAASPNVSAAAAAPGAASRKASALKDGTYSGSGMSRHGGVTVKVTIQNGRIVSAPITGVTTRYSVNVIAGLPAEVIAGQSTQIDLVSGATDSSMAYQSAVAQALAQALGGSTTSTTTSANTSAGSAVTGPQAGASGGSVQVTGPRGTIYSNGGGRRARGGGDDFGR